MALLNAINCLYGAQNTGVNQCSVDIKFLNGLILVPKKTTLTTSSLSAFNTALTALLYNASKTARGYPVYDIRNWKVNNEAKTVQTFADKSKAVVVEGYNDWQGQFVSGGATLMKALRAFNGSNWDFFLWDNDTQGNKLIGMVGSGSTIQAIPTDGGLFWSDPWVPNDGSKVSEYYAGVVFNQKYVTDSLGVMQLAAGTFPNIAYPGLINLNIAPSATVNGTTKNFNITIVSDTGVDLGALYSGISGMTGSSPALWNGSVTSGGAALTISSATWVPSTTAGVPGYFTIVVGTTNYPGSTGTNLTFSLSAPATLVAAGIVGEAVPATTVPSN
ncbi:MAG: hypothetical protein JST87_05260 [Bacteroidetes bacterium]|nr:hypothetical protein [Bacteroidota bacterium]